MTRLPALALLLVGMLHLPSGEALAQFPTTLPRSCGATTPASIQASMSRPLSCGFDRITMSYAGSPVEQARCLLRPVGILAQIGAPLARLPGNLEQLIGQPTGIQSARLAAYLQQQGVKPEEVGGPVQAPLSSTSDGHPARYFVIHDTSHPMGTGPFPPNMDNTSWPPNRFQGVATGEAAKAHVFISRTGTSMTTRQYSIPWRATKAELCVIADRSRGLFLHHELIQPRRTDTRKRIGSEELAPVAPLLPFTPPQLDRLALLYVVASVRAGTWLIPAYHATIDERLDDGQDDPQGFDLADWGTRVEAVIARIQGE